MKHPFLGSGPPIGLELSGGCVNAGFLTQQAGIGTLQVAQVSRPEAGRDTKPGTHSR